MKGIVIVGAGLAGLAAAKALQLAKNPVERYPPSRSCNARPRLIVLPKNSSVGINRCLGGYQIRAPNKAAGNRRCVG